MHTDRERFVSSSGSCDACTAGLLRGFLLLCAGATSFRVLPMISTIGLTSWNFPEGRMTFCSLCLEPYNPKRVMVQREESRHRSFCMRRGFSSILVVLVLALALPGLASANEPIKWSAPLSAYPNPWAPTTPPPAYVNQYANQYPLLGRLWWVSTVHGGHSLLAARLCSRLFRKPLHATVHTVRLYCPVPGPHALRPCEVAYALPVGFRTKSRQQTDITILFPKQIQQPLHGSVAR